MSDVPQAETPVDNTDGGRADHSSATIEGLLADLADFTEDAPAAETRDTVGDIKQLLAETHKRGLIESDVRTLRTRDVAEAFVGSVIFASPLLVEGGIVDIADHLFGFTISGVPVFLIANTLFVVFMTYALIEWTGRDRDESAVLLGVVPVRLLMTLAVSFCVATLLMTLWGRVDGWQSPIEAIARINVLWTVGSLGAALGDILSDNTAPVVTDRGAPARIGTRGESPPGGDDTPPADDPESERHLSDGELVSALHAEFDDLESAVGSSRDRDVVNEIRERTTRATLDQGFGDDIRKYTSRDIAEALVGSVFFSIPLLVEDGVFDVAAYFLSFRFGPVPVFFLLNAAFVLVMILALVYWAGPQDVYVNRPILGVVPRRLVGIAVVSFLTAAALMTMWGRVSNWEDPVVALARISVVWTVASFGASLGDILPGESSGRDINDDWAALGD